MADGRTEAQIQEDLVYMRKFVQKFRQEERIFHKRLSGNSEGRIPPRDEEEMEAIDIVDSVFEELAQTHPEEIAKKNPVYMMEKHPEVMAREYPHLIIRKVSHDMFKPLDSYNDSDQRKLPTGRFKTNTKDGSWGVVADGVFPQGEEFRVLVRDSKNNLEVISVVSLWTGVDFYKDEEISLCKITERLQRRGFGEKDDPGRPATCPDYVYKPKPAVKMEVDPLSDEDTAKLFEFVVKPRTEKEITEHMGLSIIDFRKHCHNLIKEGRLQRENNPIRYLISNPVYKNPILDDEKQQKKESLRLETKNSRGSQDSSSKKVDSGLEL